MEDTVDDPVEGQYQRIPSPAMGRDVHLWTFGWWGAPVLVFPTAGGMAHEWKHNGVVEALANCTRVRFMEVSCCDHGRYTLSERLNAISI